MTRPRILGHRGVSGRFPENSLEAFRAAVSEGLDGVELDIHSAADGTIVVHHDPDLPVLGPIHQVTLPRLKEVRLRNGEAIPTLPEALRVLDGLEVWIEIKGLDPRFDSQLLRIIAESPAPARCAVHSFDHRIVARLGQANPALRRGILSTGYPVDPVGPMTRVGATALWQQWQLIDRGLVDAVGSAGGEVIAWTVNETAVARTLRSLGVEALCGNYPERLRVG